MNPIRLLLFLLTVTMVMIAVMRWHGAPLITPVSKAGIVSLELAKTTKQASKIINVWKHLKESPDLIRHAITNTYIDFVFIIFYSLFLYSYCTFISTKQKQFPAGISRTLGMAALTAGFCDVVENYFMLLQLEQHVSATNAFLVWFFALIKFILLAATVLWCLLNVHLVFRKAV